MYELNIQKMLEHRGSVVHCSTEDDAKRFMMYMKEYHNRKCNNWIDGETAWRVYEEKTVYYPYFERKDSKLLYGSLDKVESHYVVEFSELLPVPDLPIGTVECDLAMLFS